MFASLDVARSALNSAAADFDAGTLSPEVATRVVDQLGAITPVADGMLGKAAATINPDAEQHLLDVAKHGLVPLRDACVAARAAVEDPATAANGNTPTGCFGRGPTAIACGPDRSGTRPKSARR
jgi:hypothetical protein